MRKLEWDENTQSVACKAGKKRSLGGVAAIEDQMHAPESAARKMTRTKQAKHRRRRHAAKAKTATGASKLQSGPVNRPRKDDGKKTYLRPPKAFRPQAQPEQILVQKREYILASSNIEGPKKHLSYTSSPFALQRNNARCIKNGTDKGSSITSEELDFISERRSVIHECDAANLTGPSIIGGEMFWRQIRWPYSSSCGVGSVSAIL